ncbi:monooxygenase [Sphingobium sp. SCG-1]|uniref:flavin reductase family protein n=1 Tax=Sphingobium sp. SCG-1 TaxID=2072936 RepID=UPI000CD6C5CF|nr:flavin reductase family protein [Sphingobium sp. SCG-1]AUW60124.1 monooxygenase [Sphingobium sp. SCG-1]
MSVVDPQQFRHVLGHHPTGVCIITTVLEDGAPAGMAVGSFLSVSLDPPLVGFLPAKTSASWTKIEKSPRFCVNILADNQVDLCQRFASKTEDKFAGVAHHMSASGLPMIDRAVGWIECTRHAIQDAGDHYFVLGAVETLALADDRRPLIFFRGNYGQFMSLPRWPDPIV